jgi:DNA-3-methyladenine glycosylase I
MMTNKNTVRCPWVKGRQNEMDYHDTEWGVPVTDDAKLFEFLLLDTFQAGLSWQTILVKRANFYDAFDGFDAVKIALYNDRKIEELMHNKGIIRNLLKIKSSISNAQLFLKIQNEEGSFAKYIWQFTNHKTICNRHVLHSDIATTSPESDAMSAALRKAGFKFVGSTICYAFMQAAGMVNDHTLSCFRYPAIHQMAIV